MHQRLLVLILFLSTTVAACATNSASNGASGAAATGSSDVKVLNGCRVDPARICNNIRGQSVTMADTGMQADSRMLEQNSARTASIEVPINKPNGDEIFTVECGMNTLNQSVSWAHVKTGPPVTDADATYLRGAGYCSEP